MFHEGALGLGFIQKVLRPHLKATSSCILEDSFPRTSSLSLVSASSLDLLLFPPFLTCRIPGEDSGLHLSSPRMQQRAVLGPVPLTRTSRTRTLRDQEDEIFKLWCLHNWLREARCWRSNLRERGAWGEAQEHGLPAHLPYSCHLPSLLVCQEFLGLEQFYWQG